MTGQKTLVFCWELGSGNGHVGPFQPVARRFLEAGWRVVLVVRSLSRVPRFFPGGECEVYQAPWKCEPSSQHIPLPKTFGEMLLNVGYRESAELETLVRAWRGLFEFLKPDILLFEHCPTGLLASRGLEVPRFTVGNGFYIPVNREPLANLTPWWQTSEEVRRQEERVLVERMNGVLSRRGQPGLARLGALFTEGVTNLFTTFAEMDHNGPRPGNSYFGMIQPNSQSGLPAAPHWPDFPGPRVFAYLRPMPQLMEILKGLSARRVPTLAVVEEMNRASLAEQLGPNITLLDHPVDLSQVTRECDLAVHYAGHGTVCRFLLAGVPQLLIPIAVEQGLNSHRVKQLGAGLYTAQGDPEGVDAPLSRMLKDLSAYPGARAFREKYRTWDQQASVEELFRILIESC